MPTIERDITGNETLRRAYEQGGWRIEERKAGKR